MMPPALALGLYGLFMRGAQPLLRRKLARRAQAEPGYGLAVAERFGHYTQPMESRSELVWVHAVSLGETRAAAVLLQALRAAQPGLRLLLTHGTATGRAEGAALLRPGDVQVWQPWDTPQAVQRFLARFKPQLGVLMETEVWPQLVAQCRAAAVPLALVNARLSEKSQKQAQRWLALARPAYGGLAGVWAQTEPDARRLRELGAPVQGVLGNLKFDAWPNAGQQALGRAVRSSASWPVLMFASSREGEEALFLQAWRRHGPAGVQPLLVPRHPQRFDEVAALAESAGWQVLRRSQWGAQLEHRPAPLPGTLWLGDSLGEMALYYSLSQVALLGGSFAPLGGQNLIEAAACGCPVLMGPHTFNFSEAAEAAQAEGAAERVNDLDAALARVPALCEATRHLAAAEAAQAFAARHRGAAEATAAALRPWLVRTA